MTTRRNRLCRPSLSERSVEEAFLLFDLNGRHRAFCSGRTDKPKTHTTPHSHYPLRNTQRVLMVLFPYCAFHHVPTIISVRTTLWHFSKLCRSYRPTLSCLHFLFRFVQCPFSYLHSQDFPAVLQHVCLYCSLIRSYLLMQAFGSHPKGRDAFASAPAVNTREMTEEF